jgi:hypothetical protein
MRLLRRIVTWKVRTKKAFVYHLRRIKEKRSEEETE